MEHHVDGHQGYGEPGGLPAESLIVRFAGDSGDGMQLTGDRLANVSALFGQQVVTLADFPAEIRAPQGTTYGVSGYQVNIGGNKVMTPGDGIDLLVAMNAAALHVNLDNLNPGCLVIINEDGFDDKNHERAELSQPVLKDPRLRGVRVVKIDITKQTIEALKDSPLGKAEKARCKNFFALGLVSWLLDRPFEVNNEWIAKKFGQKPEVAAANQDAFKEGYTQGEVRELFNGQIKTVVPEAPAKQATGKQRFIGGNLALVYGLLAAREKAAKKLFFAGYPITPASDILHEMTKHVGTDLVTFQAEDEMAACGAAVGAAFTGALAVTATSGPGMILKQEFIALAVMTELPLVVLDIQRAGPSTGMPTKTEQADLNLALYGRNGEAPVVVVAPQSPGDCFRTAFEACQIALRYMTPVVVLSEAYLANGNESWWIPKMADLPTIDLQHLEPPAAADFRPYERDKLTLARPWVKPGQAGYEHRIGGLEKEAGTGKVSYDGANHENMIALRQAKVAAAAQDYLPTEVTSYGSRTAVVSWGGSFGAVRKGCQEVQSLKPHDHIHLRYLNPLPTDLDGILAGYDEIKVIENNAGHLLMKLRNEYPDYRFTGIQRMTGQPLKVSFVKQVLLASQEAR